MEKTPPCFPTFFENPEKKSIERARIYFTMDFAAKQAISQRLQSLESDRIGKNLGRAGENGDDPNHGGKSPRFPNGRQ
jgi:hypothetical protein